MINLFSLSRHFLSVATLLIISQLITSCSKNEPNAVNSKTSDEISVKDGRLYFSSKELYSNTAKQLIYKTYDEQVAWSKSFNYVPYGSDKARSFPGPGFYKVLLNENNEVQLENMIMKIEDNDVVTVPSDRKDLVQKLRVNVKDQALDPYRESFTKGIPINVGDNGPSSGVRLAAEKRWSYPVYHEIGQPRGDGTRFRYTLEANEYKDFASGSVGISLYLEYYFSNKSAWYLAGEKITLQISNINWSYSYRPYSPATTGYSSGVFSYSSNKIGVDLFTYNDPGYVPKINIQADWFAQFSPPTEYRATSTLVNP